MVVGAVKAAVGDLVLTFMWVFCSSMLGIVSSAITKALDLQNVSYNGFPYPSLIVTTTLVFLLVFLFTMIGNAMGGASFNPTGTAAFYSVGLGSDTLFSMALRFPAQVLYTLMFFSTFSFFCEVKNSIFLGVSSFFVLILIFLSMFELFLLWKF